MRKGSRQELELHSSPGEDGGLCFLERAQANAPALPLKVWSAGRDTFSEWTAGSLSSLCWPVKMGCSGQCK